MTIKTQYDRGSVGFRSSTQPTEAESAFRDRPRPSSGTRSTLTMLSSNKPDRAYLEENLYERPKNILR